MADVIRLTPSLMAMSGSLFALGKTELEESPIDRVKFESVHSPFVLLRKEYKNGGKWGSELRAIMCIETEELSVAFELTDQGG